MRPIREPIKNQFGSPELIWWGQKINQTQSFNLVKWWSRDKFEPSKSLSFYISNTKTSQQRESQPTVYVKWILTIFKNQKVAWGWEILRSGIRLVFCSAYRSFLQGKAFFWIAWIHEYVLKGKSFGDVLPSSTGSWNWRRLIQSREIVAFSFQSFSSDNKIYVSKLWVNLLEKKKYIQM